MSYGGVGAAAVAQAAAAAARVTPATATWNKPLPQCSEHLDVKWLVPTAFRQAELEPPCFVCDPGWWAEHVPPPMTPDVDKATGEDPGALARAMLVQRGVTQP